MASKSFSGPNLHTISLLMIVKLLDPIQILPIEFETHNSLLFSGHIHWSITDRSYSTYLKPVAIHCSLFFFFLIIIAHLPNLNLGIISNSSVP